jgi:hypothetical protein
MTNFSWTDSLMEVNGKVSIDEALQFFQSIGLSLMVTMYVLETHPLLIN